MISDACLSIKSWHDGVEAEVSSFLKDNVAHSDADVRQHSRSRREMDETGWVDVPDLATSKLIMLTCHQRECDSITSHPGEIFQTSL